MDVELKISNCFIITVDKDRSVIADGIIVINDGRIIEVGPASNIDKKYKARRTIDATGKVAIPGLIDVHAHAGHGLIKTMGMNNDWEKICGGVYTEGSTEEFWYYTLSLHDALPI